MIWSLQTVRCHDSLVQDWSIPIDKVLEIMQSCTEPSAWSCTTWYWMQHWVTRVDTLQHRSYFELLWASYGVSLLKKFDHFIMVSHCIPVAPLTLKWLGHLFQNVISFLMLFTLCAIVLYETGPINECLISIVDTDGLVPKHQGISSHSVDYAPMRFPVFKG